MDNDELIRFNPILAKALAKAEKEHSQEGSAGKAAIEFLREFVALAVKTGTEPATIYATIKTGRIVTNENMKLLTKADIKEWQDATREYDELSSQKTGDTKGRKTMSKHYKLEIGVTIGGEGQVIELARKIYADGPGASEPVNDNSEEERTVPPEEFIADIEDALMELVQSNPLLEQAGVEVDELSVQKSDERG